MTLAELRGDVVILACAVSAGIHGALTPGHFDEGTGAGLGFAAATVVLAALAVWLTWRSESAVALATAAVVLVGLLVSYALATTTGVPLLDLGPEPRARDQGDRDRRSPRGLEPALASPVALTLPHPKEH